MKKPTTRALLDKLFESANKERKAAGGWAMGARVPAKPTDTKYSDEEPPRTPFRYGHDASDPAGLWNPPGPAVEWPPRKRREGYGKVRRDS